MCSRCCDKHANCSRAIRSQNLTYCGQAGYRWTTATNVTSTPKNLLVSYINLMDYWTHWLVKSETGRLITRLCGYDVDILFITVNGLLQRATSNGRNNCLKRKCLLLHAQQRFGVIRKEEIKTVYETYFKFQSVQMEYSMNKRKLAQQCEINVLH